MARPATPHPTSSEFGILRVLWDRGPLTVRDVHTSVAAASGVSYTTVLKTMQIRLEKNLLTRDDSQRSHLYEAAVSQQSTQSQLLKRVLDLAFEGSITKLLQGAIQSRAASAKELREIQKLIEEQQK